MKIAQPERGGNGVRAAVVNQTFPWAFCPVRRITEPVWADRPQIAARFSRALSRSDNLLLQIITWRGLSFRPLNLFDCATAQSFCGLQGRKGFVR